MKKIITLSTLLGFILAFAQTNLKVAYQFKYLTDSTNKYSEKEDLMVLHHLGETSYYYSELKRKGDSTRQADINKGMDMATMMANRDKYGRGKVALSVVKDFSKKQLSFVEPILEKTYEYTEAIPSIDWKTTNEKQKILNYEVVKAVGSFGGRVWEAWFAPAIPVADGPYKFQGLPGLILKVQDTKQNFVMTAVAIEQNRPQNFTPTKENLIRTNKKKYQELKALSVRDFMKFVNVNSEVSISPKNPQTSQPKERPYNPIELN